MSFNVCFLSELLLNSYLLEFYAKHLFTLYKLFIKTFQQYIKSMSSDPYNFNMNMALQLQDNSQDNSSHNLTTSDIQELYHSKLRLKDFIKSLGEYRSTGLHKAVLEYYNQVNQKSLTPQNILKMTQKRVEKMIKNKKIKKNWSVQDVNILIWILSKYLEKNFFSHIDQLSSIDWKNISELIPGSTGSRCMFKWLSLKKFNLSSYKWGQSESEILSNLVKQHGLKDWKLISQKLYKINTDKNKIFRNAKQCRQHWSCYLNPKLKKGPWEIKEDKKLLECIISNGGLKRWSEIARKFHGRTQNALKNRYNLIIEKQKRIFKNKDQIFLIKEQLSRLSQNQEQCSESQSEYRNEQPISVAQDKDEEIFEDDRQDDHQVNNENQQPLLETVETTPTNMKIVKSNYQDLVQYMKNNYISDKQMVPAILTDNNQCLLNMIYGATFFG